MAMFNRSCNQVCGSSSSLSDRNHGRSKAQMCLKKIVDFISSSSKPVQIGDGSFLDLQTDKQQQHKEATSGRRGFDIDLNLRLGPCCESESENKGVSACCSCVGEKEDGDKVCKLVFGDIGGVGDVDDVGDVSTLDKSSEGECDPKEIINEDKEVVVQEDEETRELSEITNLQVRSSEIENKENDQDGQQSEINAGKQQVEVEEQSKLLRSNLDLLVEAARLISGNFDDDEDDETQELKKLSEIGRLETQSKDTESVRLESEGNENWMLDCFEDISPIVRSKRGRNQVLPFRYRDSVLEPWKRLTKQRSSRASTKQRTK